MSMKQRKDRVPALWSRTPFGTIKRRRDTSGGSLLASGVGGIPIQIGGMADHVHILATLRQEPAIAAFMRDLKAASSGWVHDTFPDATDFWWQRVTGHSRSATRRWTT